MHFNREDLPIRLIDKRTFHVSSLIKSGNALNTGEFNALQISISRKGNPLSQKIFNQIKSARAFDELHNKE